MNALSPSAIARALFLVLISCASVTFAADDFFSTKVEPVLRARCFECHSHDKKIEGGLALDSRSGWETGGDSGPAVVPGKTELSLLLKAISHTEVDLKMPPKQRLPASEIALLTEWVRRGAPDPRVLTATATARLSTGDDWEAEFQKRLDWWSLQPMRRVAPPPVADVAWQFEPVDAFIRAKLEQEKLSPASAATPEVLLRRLSFVLTGLPPTLSDIEAWRRDLAEDSRGTSAMAYERLVDRLLASPRFGERFARHWMDVVRYTDTYGYEWDNPAKGSHEYRDYLIRAFNDDIGFDQLLREQLAGDLLAEQRTHSTAGTHESFIGPMFFHLGEHRHGSSLMFNGIHQEMVNNKIDAFSKAFLATTVACARCHDHKLEAVSQQDYYALAAVFTTPRWTSRVADAPGWQDTTIQRLKQLRGEIRRALAERWRQVEFTTAQIQAALGDVSKAMPLPHDIAYPLARFTNADVDVPSEWTKLRDQWRMTREQRLQANQTFRTITDFADASLPAGWVSEGDGWQHGRVDEGTPLVALEGDAVVARLLPRGVFTHALSSKLPGSLRMPPQHLVPGKFVSVKICGGEFGGYLALDDHALQNETITLLTNLVPEWRSIADATLKNGVREVTIEFATCSLNPNFPPRTGLAKGLKNNDFGFDKRSWVGITKIVAHDTAGTPQDELAPFATLYESAAPSNREETWRTFGDWFAAAVARWRDERLQPGDEAILNWLLEKKLLPNQAEPDSRLAALVAEYRRVEASLAFPRTVNSMDEREVVKTSYPLNVRGNVDSVGKPIAPDFLRMFAGKNSVAAAAGSGRLELAASLLDPEHPLTARVYVNRVWQWMFGAGLVATPDDFGRLGQRPSHPELLDWLARDFIRDGWSTKRLVRRLALSQTFRQGSAANEEARRRDPDNRWLHHYPTRRLEAEALRDAILTVSGRLDSRFYGRPIPPPRAVEDPPKRLFSGPVDGYGRRSLYMQMSIMDPPKFLVGFNLPDLKLPTGRRDVTNVPAQALMLMNDPFVQSQAKVWAARLLATPHSHEAERLREMFLSAFGREPTEEERTRWLTALPELASSPTAPRMQDEQAWRRIAHALFNSKEFLYYR